MFRRIDFQSCRDVGGDPMCLPGRVRGARENLASVGNDSVADVRERAAGVIEQGELLVVYGSRSSK